MAAICVRSMNERTGERQAKECRPCSEGNVKLRECMACLGYIKCRVKKGQETTTTYLRYFLRFWFSEVEGEWEALECMACFSDI